MELVAVIFILLGALIAFYVLTGGNWKSKSFWKSQFDSTVTQSQVIFDVVLGVIMPVLCLVFDPVVFRNLLPLGQAILSSIKIFGYVSIILGIIALSLWLLLRHHLSWLNAFLAGILLYGAFFALLLGIVLLPFSVIGLLGLVGILGLHLFSRHLCSSETASVHTSRLTNRSERRGYLGLALH